MLEGRGLVRRSSLSESFVQPPAGCRRFEGIVSHTTDPYQLDWSHEYAVLGGKTTKVKAAHMRLCYRRMSLVQLYPRASQEMVFDAHERAFQFFGGVCQRGISDDVPRNIIRIMCRRA